MESSQPKRKKPVIKKMYFKKAEIKKVAATDTPLPASAPAPAQAQTQAQTQANTIDLTTPTGSQESPPASQPQRDVERKREVNDLDFWGRAKDVHAGMQKISQEKRQKEVEARRRKAKTTAAAAVKEEKKKVAEPTRSSKRRKSDDKTAILIDDDDDEDDTDPLRRKDARDRTLTPTTSVELIDPSEIDKVLEAFNKSKAEVAAEVAARSRVFSPPLSTQLPASQSAASTDPNDAFKDTVIQILIISAIPGTKPMVFNRKFGQTLGKVRDVWARMQGFTDEQIERLILVWQNETRVFDSTVPKSLGIKFDKNGKMYFGGKGKQEEKNGVKPEECRVFFDAMWDEEYEELMKRKEAAKERENALELSSDGEDEEVVTGVAVNAQMIEITLKGKHFEEMKLKVQPSMKVSEVIEQMRDERKLDEGTEIELHFDGEELEEDMTLEEADIEDEFQIDVVLR
ncbi:hypothetical protein TWF481_012231 [Arthrobotrys musiformis]|uniref:Ubiquitin-like domain-containing protein n=1 Tax=Arthrobotrys musiformis TaxID=47236 RepID=A0AAV9VWH7_9PEZI